MSIPQKYPQKNFQKVKFFSPQKPTTQKPHPHHQSTTTSPQKTITKNTLFPKPPLKTLAISHKNPAHPTGKFFKTKTPKTH
jgi:hypothetical protein